MSRTSAHSMLRSDAHPAHNRPDTSRRPVASRLPPTDVMNAFTADPVNLRVLVVDDKADAARMLAATLTSEGRQVTTVADAHAAFERLTLWRPDLILIDLALPAADLLELCRRIRTLSQVPIIVLSENADEAAIVQVLDSGADDYLVKPVGTGELLARIRARLSRSGGDARDESFQAGVFQVNMDTHRVHVRESEVRLTPKEFDLFVYMARHPNRVLDHRRLLGAVWGDASRDQPEYLRVYMGQLRKKLEPNPSSPRYLLTEPWVGYTFNPEG
jgi:two-component system KDP operon response regulator KdpE